jgi:hypothetical protein
MHQETPVVMLQIYEIMTYISGILYYVSTTINPILYHIMSLKFRDAFKVSSLLQNVAGCSQLCSQTVDGHVSRYPFKEEAQTAYLTLILPN